MLSRLSAVRRLPRAFSAPIRQYADGRTEGTVAQSKGFNKKEKAHEDQFVHRHEQEQLAKLKAQIEAKESELNSLKKEKSELESQSKE